MSGRGKGLKKRVKPYKVVMKLPDKKILFHNGHFAMKLRARNPRNMVVLKTKNGLHWPLTLYQAKNGLKAVKASNNYTYTIRGTHRRSFVKNKTGLKLHMSPLKNRLFAASPESVPIFEVAEQNLEEFRFAFSKAIQHLEYMKDALPGSPLTLDKEKEMADAIIKVINPKADKTEVRKQIEACIEAYPASLRRIAYDSVTTPYFEALLDGQKKYRNQSPVCRRLVFEQLN